MNIVQVVAAGVAGVFGGLLVLLYTFQDNLLYHPTIPAREYTENPTDYALPYDDVELVTDDGIRLHGWLIRRPDSRRSATFLYFHGNAGNIGHRLSDVRRFYESGFNIFMVSYRGYGSSEGKPSETGLKLDARAALSYCRRRTDVVDTDRLFIFGRSIGGAVAIATAVSARAGEIAGIVVENSFTSIDDMIDVVLPPLKPVKIFNRNHWNSIKEIESLETPILFISGLRDRLVPPRHMQDLFSAASKSPKKEFYTVDDGDHNDTWFKGGRGYREAIRSFVDNVILSQSQCEGS